MAKIQNFNAAEVEPDLGFRPIPAGDYLAIVDESDEEETKAGTGSFYKLRFQVIDGPHKGRTIFHRLNVNNPNQQAVSIARAQLSAICRAVGVLAPSDTVELHNIPLGISIAVTLRRDTGEPTNEIKKFVARGELSPTNGASGSVGRPSWL